MLATFIRIITYSLNIFLNTSLTYWPLMLWPQIFRECFEIKNLTQQAVFASYYYILYYYGNILSSLLWPYIVHYVSVKNCVFIALLFQFITSIAFVLVPNLYFMLFLRFISGIFKNSSHVGKDFIYGFCEDRYRQHGFAFISVFTFAAVFIGPVAGIYMFKYSQNSFSICFAYIAFFYAIEIIVFVVVFYITYNPPISESTLYPSIADEEEKQKLIGKKHKKMGFFEACKYIWMNPRLRGLTILFIIAKSVNKSYAIISVFFIEASWEKEGLGISPITLATINLITFIPVMIVLILVPCMVPRYIGYRTYLNIILSIYTIGITIMPMLKTFIGILGYEKFYWLVFIVQGVIYLVNPKTYTPSISYLINKATRRRGRTAVNSITSLLFTTFTAGLLTIIAPLYSRAVHDEKWVKYKPFNIYITFFILSVLMLLSILLLNKSKMKI